MSPEERRREWKYHYDERLGMLCEDRKPTMLEKVMAIADANKAIVAIERDEAKFGE